MAYENSHEPMDIDLSAQSNNAMDISSMDNSSSFANDKNAYLEANDCFYVPSIETAPDKTLLQQTLTDSSNTPIPTQIKQFRIKMPKEKRKPHYLSSYKTKIICSIAILLLSLVTYQVLNIQCSNDINPDELKKSISAKLFGQSQAIKSLIEALNVKEKSKILFFYGGIGVGKTFTASLILEHVGYYSNVYHYIMPSFIETDFMVGLSMCRHTTVIIDDIDAKDMNVISHIKDILRKSQQLNKDVTIILIYNCNNGANDYQEQCDENFSSKLLNNFNGIDAFKKFIKFEPLREKHLKQCIETELGKRHLTSLEYQKLMKNFNVSLDGCKGVYTKIKLMEML